MSRTPDDGRAEEPSILLTPQLSRRQLLQVSLHSGVACAATALSGIRTASAQTKLPTPTSAPTSAALGHDTAVAKLADGTLLPAQPLSLPPWSHGSHSAATNTVLMFRGNATHTFYGTGPIPDQPRLHWTFQTDSFSRPLRGENVTWAGTGWTGQAVRVGEYVFVGSVDRNLYALSAATGALQWRHHASGMFKSSPCIFENRLYVGNVDDYVRCLDLATGAELWRHNTTNDCDSSPCIVDGRLYIAGEAGYVWCLDPRTGTVLWQRFVGGVGPGTIPGSNGSETSPAVDQGELYTGTFDGFLYSLDAGTGRQRWRFPTGDDTDSSPVLSGELVYIATEEDHPALFCLRRKDGKEVWSVKNGGGYWSTPAVVGNKLWIGSQSAHMTCADARTGAAQWDVRVGRSIWSSPCVVDNRVIFGSYDHFLYMLDSTSGKLVWRYDLGGACVSTACIVDGYIYIGNATGTFFCFGP